MNREELKELGLEEARARLSDEEFQRWTKLRKQELKQEAETHIREKNKETSETAQKIIDQSRGEYSKEIGFYGSELMLDLNINREQKQRLMKLNEYRNNSKEENLQYLDEIEELTISFLDSVIKNLSKSDLETIRDDAGYQVLQELGKRVNEEITKDMEEVQQFR